MREWEKYNLTKPPQIEKKLDLLGKVLNNVDVKDLPKLEDQLKNL